jgi:ABC-2 type transport system ATP-binding protein
VVRVIEVCDLSKRYGRVVAVDGLSFTVRPGMVTGFLGPNGAGKSTTMRMMLGLDRPTGGDVRIDGERYRDMRHPLRRVGALLEAKSVHGGRSGYNHLLWLAQTNGIPRSRVREVLEQVGIAEVGSRRAKALSLGMGQRLGIAAALLGDPPVLLFDEPVNGLDPEGVVWARELFRGLAAEGRTVFVSSHLMTEMAMTADHLVVVARGRLLADTTVSEFVAESGTDSLEAAFLRLTAGGAR